jgi:hypothetical protein
VTLIILRVADLAGALLDGLVAHPAGDSDTDTTHELNAAYDATIEFFRSLLELRACQFCSFSCASVRTVE